MGELKQLELEARLLGQLSDAAKIAVGINVNPPASIDYSLLSDEEFELLEGLIKKATAVRH